MCIVNEIRTWNFHETPPVYAVQGLIGNHFLQDVRYSVYGVGLLISVVFLCATLVVSFLVPSNHHVLHWRCQTYYVFCLLIGDLLLAITQLSGDSIKGPFCAVTGM